MKGIVIIVIVAAIVVLGFIVRMSRENDRASQDEDEDTIMAFAKADSVPADGVVSVITPTTPTTPNYTPQYFIQKTGQNPYNEAGDLVDQYTDGDVAALFEHYQNKNAAYDQGWQPGMAVPSY
jgi:hypothetical protein